MTEVVGLVPDAYTCFHRCHHTSAFWYMLRCCGVVAVLLSCSGVVSVLRSSVAMFVVVVVVVVRNHIPALSRLCQSRR